jgi:hypothetical protein
VEQVLSIATICVDSTVKVVRVDGGAARAPRIQAVIHVSQVDVGVEEDLRLARRPASDRVGVEGCAAVAGRERRAVVDDDPRPAQAVAPEGREEETYVVLLSRRRLEWSGHSLKQHSPSGPTVTVAASAIAGASETAETTTARHRNPRSDRRTNPSLGFCQ